MSRLDAAKQRLWGALEGRFEGRRRIAQATVTAVTRDSSGRATEVTATIDGTAGQKVAVPYGMALGVGSVFSVENVGLVTQPAWRVADATSGMPGSTVILLTTPGGTPVVTEGGLVLGAANLLRNPDFMLTHRGHVNQPIGWVASDVTHILGTMGEE